MSSSVSQILVAVLGIGGTLASALLTQRAGNRARDRELQHARQLQADEREYVTRQTRLEARRTCYAALNAGTRDFINVMTKLVHALERDEVTEELRSDLDRSRRDHRLRHAEAQMVLPDPVMTAASTVNRHFGDLYGLLLRLDRGTPEPGENVEAARETMNRLWDALWTMRHVMRVDLGITPPDEGA
ncbi:hypothetical protein [Streptomyces cylindrosporus]|uniref:Secreted protein n=1 Tax=Streptomyces cylindrosporus TaxID=2927583 RepID=A0ABS9YHP9_9ACTN|nr:hypothetical protein [Streptomyces cylindrosporus]MCI3276754.1 hypothetical protein [Streptomyces cylindrosporus]